MAAAMKAVTFGAGQRRDHAARGGEDRGGRRHLCPGDRCQQFYRRLQELEDGSKARASARIAESGSHSFYNR